MGVVYEAYDERLQRPVAIKMLRQAGLDEQASKRLWREARVAASVNHPNVCQIYEIGEESGELFIAMELLQGESLATVLDRGPLPAANATQIMLGVLVALEALQRREIVHRDLKPSNIFQTAHGIKLLDFGLAAPVKSVNPDHETATVLTVTGTVVGTWKSGGMIAGTPVATRYPSPVAVDNPCSPGLISRVYSGARIAWSFT